MIDEKLHKDIKDYCKYNNLKIKDYINSLLKTAFMNDLYGFRPMDKSANESDKENLVLVEKNTNLEKENKELKKRIKTLEDELENLKKGESVPLSEKNGTFVENGPKNGTVRKRKLN